MAFPGGDLRSRILANHRLPAYRVRAWAHCKAAAGPDELRHEDAATSLIEDLLPRIDVRTATADFPPMPPLEGNGATTNRCHCSTFLWLLFALSGLTCLQCKGGDIRARP